VSDDRRRARRRNIPFVRSAVLEVRGRNHIVAVQDLSADGAFLSTRIPMQDGERLRLRTILPRDGREVTIPCQVVWTSEKLDASSGRPAGVAVRFVGLDPTIQRRLAEFSAEGFAPGPEPSPLQHYEYRVTDVSEIVADELNQLGLDGWQLAAALPAGKLFRLVFVRRL